MMEMSDVEAIGRLVPGFSPLPESSRSYFLVSDSSKEIELDLLVSTRLRPEGVRNAALLMSKAAAGQLDRRAPITVSARPDGRWDVLDGNSTVAIARLSGWCSIPCFEVSADPTT